MYMHTPSLLLSSMYRNTYPLHDDTYHGMHHYVVSTASNTPHYIPPHDAACILSAYMHKGICIHIHGGGCIANDYVHTISWYISCYAFMCIMVCIIPAYIPSVSLSKGYNRG